MGCTQYPIEGILHVDNEYEGCKAVSYPSFTQFCNKQPAMCLGGSMVDRDWRWGFGLRDLGIFERPE